MDDRTFNDVKIALEWISLVEGESARIREQDIYPRLREWASRALATEILEIGSGQGICSAEIQSDHIRYTGVDPSTILVHRAKELFSSENRVFLLGNAYSLPLPNSSFGAVFSVAVWHLLGSLQDAANEMVRVLRPDGRFLIITANPAAYSLWTNRYVDAKLEGRRFEGRVAGSESVDVLHLHTLEEILRPLRAANLIIQKTETFRPAINGQEHYISIEGRKLSGT